MSDPSTSPKSPVHRNMFLAIGAALVAGVVGVGTAALLVDITEKKQQAKTPFFRVVELTDDTEAYVLPGVPWVSFFEPENGVAFHGTYWHQNYGMPMSHGCINMVSDEAKWLYRWTTPIATPADWEKRGHGTQVTVF